MKELRHEIKQNEDAIKALWLAIVSDTASLENVVYRKEYQSSDFTTWINGFAAQNRDYLQAQGILAEINPGP